MKTPTAKELAEIYFDQIPKWSRPEDREKAMQAAIDALLASVPLDVTVEDIKHTLWEASREFDRGGTHDRNAGYAAVLNLCRASYCKHMEQQGEAHKLERDTMTREIQKLKGFVDAVMVLPKKWCNRRSHALKGNDLRSARELGFCSEQLQETLSTISQPSAESRVDQFLREADAEKPIITQSWSKTEEILRQGLQEAGIDPDEPSAEAVEPVPSKKDAEWQAQYQLVCDTMNARLAEAIQRAEAAEARVKELGERISSIKTDASEWKKLAAKNGQEADDLRRAIGVDCDMCVGEGISVAKTMREKIATLESRIAALTPRPVSVRPTKEDASFNGGIRCWTSSGEIAHMMPWDFDPLIYDQIKWWLPGNLAAYGLAETPEDKERREFKAWWNTIPAPGPREEQDIARSAWMARAGKEPK